ncbi:MAG: hypothetical protein IKB55_05880 [Clostridia bacterium]|nr:hypothetical protein [Clostridia bacterium]
MNIFAYVFLIMLALSIGLIVTINIHKKTENEITRRAVISGLITGILHIVYCFAVFIITDGRFFIEYDKTNEIINGFSFTAFKYIGIVLAALIPIILCRVSNIKEFLKYVLLSCLCCLAVYAFEGIFIIIGYKLLNIFNIYIDFPLCTWDAIVLALEYLPVGSILGTFISIIIMLIF